MYWETNSSSGTRESNPGIRGAPARSRADGPRRQTRNGHRIAGVLAHLEVPPVGELVGQVPPRPHPRGPAARGRTGPSRRGASREEATPPPSLARNLQPNAASPSPARTSRVQESRNLGEEGLPSADRNNKATLLLTGPFRATKSYAKDSSPRASKLQFANHRRALRARRDVRLLRH